MRSFVGLLLFAAVILQEATASIPNCYIAVAGPRINGILAPYSGDQVWRMVDDEGKWSNVTLKKSGSGHKFHTGDIADDKHISGQWDAGTGCWLNGYVHREKGLGGSQMYAVDHPMKAPYAGRYRPNPAKHDDWVHSEQRGMVKCYVWAKSRKHTKSGKTPDGFEYNTATGNCNAVWNGAEHTDARLLNVVEVDVNSTSDSAVQRETELMERGKWLAQLLEPTPAPGSTDERRPLGPAGNMQECVALAEKKAVPVKYISFAHHLNKCYYGGAVEVEKSYSEDSEVLWTFIAKTLRPPLFESLKTKGFNCEPAA